MKDKWEKIGVIGVDSGLCWISDPCYVLHQVHNRKSKIKILKKPTPKPKDIGKDWNDFCNKIYKNNKTEKIQFNYDAGHPGLGICIPTTYGDGEYNVYAKKRNGQIIEVKIVFDEGEELNEDQKA